MNKYDGLSCTDVVVMQFNARIVLTGDGDERHVRSLQSEWFLGGNRDGCFEVTGVRWETAVGGTIGRARPPTFDRTDRD
ncbi:hypothetical protein CLE01_28740 [Cryobacterium levicorallinum]|nr:hypothetical protein CLE01_28740 [Cryobacterium levicorallinum]